MSRPTIKTLLSASSLLVGLALLTPSCANNDSSLFIVGVFDVNQSSCIAKPDNTGPFLSSGALDTAFDPGGYTAVLVVGNQMTAQGTQTRTETSRVTLQGAQVTLTQLNGQPLNTPGAEHTFSTVGTGFVDPSLGDAPSYATVAVNIIPPGLTGLPAQVLAKIRVFGNTLGGTPITSSELDFPISVCQGCLVNYDTRDPNIAVTAPFLCAMSAATTAAAVIPPCVLGQDQTFSCTLCAAANDICRDPCKSPDPAYSSSASCP